MDYNTVMKLTKNIQLLISSLLAVLCVAAYYNVLGAEFSIIDDTQAFLLNPDVGNVGLHLRNFRFQEIWYAIFYNVFGPNPFPLHISSLVFHIGNTILAFYILTLLFNWRIGLIAAALSAVHPVNTEAVSWISASHYLTTTFFTYLIIFFYALYKSTGKQKYWKRAAGTFIVTFIVSRAAWFAIRVSSIVIIDYFFWQSINYKKHFRKLLPGLAVIVLVLALFLGREFINRWNDNRDLAVINQQALIPVIQSYPFIITNMVRLYVFPKDLTFYYDGNPLTPVDHAVMYVVFTAYCGLTFYLWKRNKKYAGLLVLLPASLGASFSPIPVAWFMAERYLYFGTPFFCVFLATLFIYLEKKSSVKYLSFILTFILVLVYGYRTYDRNIDWQNSVNLAEATMKTAPYTPRPYVDKGSYLARQGKVQEAERLYRQALTINPEIDSAKNNLGYLYLRYGLPEELNNIETKRKVDTKQSEIYFYNATQTFKNENIHGSVFLLHEALNENPRNFQAREFLGDIYVRENLFEFAGEQYEICTQLDPTKDMPYFKWGYTEYQLKNYENAEKLVNKSLEMNPANPEAKILLERIKNRK